MVNHRKLTMESWPGKRDAGLGMSTTMRHASLDHSHLSNIIPFEGLYSLEHCLHKTRTLLTLWYYSPEDQATLEAEYKKNPKPDKAARMEIVKRVALGEKEVQVSHNWYPHTRWSRDRREYNKA
jgi:hypothetical protein